MFSSCEVHLMDERVRKSAEMPAFNSNKWVSRLRNSILKKAPSP